MRHSDTTQCTYREYNAIVLITILSDYIIPQITSYILPCTHMYGMTHQKALKTGIIAAILLVAAILTTTTTTATNVQAQVTHAKDAGWNQAKNDKQDGDSFNDTCPGNFDDGQCGWYKIGYNAGWAATEFLHDNDKQRDFDYNRDSNGNSNNNNEQPKRTIGGNDD
jgi:hypothetical protein